MGLSNNVAMLATFMLLAVTHAAQVSNIFKSLDLKYYKGANYPLQAPGLPSWMVTLSWEILGSKVKGGDTFSLNMPCVFKFTTMDSSVDLKVGNTAFATCKFAPGEVTVPDSLLQCTVSNSVTSGTVAKGKVSFPLTFNVGGSGSWVDLKDSKCFTPGINTVTFKDGDKELSTQVTFDSGSYWNKATGQKTDVLVAASRKVPSVNKDQFYMLGPQCAYGVYSGTLGFKANAGWHDCGSMHAAITKELNSWYFPESTDKFTFDTQCTPRGGLIVNYSNIPKGYRPFIDILVENASDDVYYTNVYKCRYENEEKHNMAYTWGEYNDFDTDSNGNAVVVITSTYYGSETMTTTLPFDNTPGSTQTVVIEVPIPTTTVTTTYGGDSTSYATATATPGGTATVTEFDPVTKTTSHTTRPENILTVTVDVTETVMTTQMTIVTDTVTY